MATYTYSKIQDSEIDQDSPVTESLMEKMARNYLAVLGADDVNPTPSADFFSAIKYSPVFTYKGDESDGAKVITSSGALPQQVYNCTDFTINAAVNATSSGPCLLVRCTGTFTMSSTSTLKAIGQSPPGGNKGGGNGGKSNDAGRFGTPELASIEKQMVLSSGSGIAGGGIGSHHGGSPLGGGWGGGCIIIVADTFNFPAGSVISVDGSTTLVTNSGGGGGGAVIALYNNLTSSAGSITYAGGAGDGTGSAGGADWEHLELI